MKKIKYIIPLLLAGLLTSTSCEEALEIEAADAFTTDFVFGDAEQLEKLVFTAYNSTESWGLNKQQWWSRRFNIEVGSFEAKFNFRDLDQLRLRAGWNPSNVGVLRQKWNIYWSYIRDITLFLDQVDESTAMLEEPDKVTILKAEMQFLRANLYHKLIQYYGGVPILENAVGLDDNFDIPRNSYEECVDFIVRELDAAADILPETRPANELGRATKIAAWQLNQEHFCMPLARCMILLPNQVDHYTIMANLANGKMPPMPQKL